jgi:transposase
VEIDGVAAINAAKIVAEVGDDLRFRSRHHFASYTGTAPTDVSSGENNRHRLNRGGNRRLNHALHIAAVVQIRMPGRGRDYYRRSRESGNTHNEAVRCLNDASPRKSYAVWSTTWQQRAGRTRGGVSSIQRG